MALPAIAPYPLPAGDELPANRVAWTADPARAVLLVHDLQNHFLGAFPPDEQPLTGMLGNATTWWRSAAASACPSSTRPSAAGRRPRSEGCSWTSGAPASPTTRRPSPCPRRSRRRPVTRS